MELWFPLRVWLAGVGVKCCLSSFSLFAGQTRETARGGVTHVLTDIEHYFETRSLRRHLEIKFWKMHDIGHQKWTVFSGGHGHCMGSGGMDDVISPGPHTMLHESSYAPWSFLKGENAFLAHFCKILMNFWEFFEKLLKPNGYFDAEMI